MIGPAGHVSRTRDVGGWIAAIGSSRVHQPRDPRGPLDPSHACARDRARRPVADGGCSVSAACCETAWTDASAQPSRAVRTERDARVAAATVRIVRAQRRIAQVPVASAAAAAAAADHSGDDALGIHERPVIVVVADPERPARTRARRTLLPDGAADPDRRWCCSAQGRLAIQCGLVADLDRQLTTQLAIVREGSDPRIVGAIATNRSAHVQFAAGRPPRGARSRR